MKNLSGKKWCDKHNCSYVYSGTPGIKTCQDWQCPFCATLETKIEETKLKRLDKAKKERIKKEKIQKRLKCACIPKNFQNKTLKNYEVHCKKQQYIMSKIQNFIKNFDDRTGFIFTGYRGTGKTHLSCAILQEIIMKHEKSGLTISIFEMMENIKSAWRNKENNNHKSVIAWIDEYAAYDLLVVEEIEKNIKSHTMQTYFFQIINKRYGNGKPTIITSNETGQQLMDIIGKSVIERFKKNGQSSEDIVLQFLWENYRERRRKEEKRKK